MNVGCFEKVKHEGKMTQHHHEFYTHFNSQSFCGLLSVNLLAACQPHSLKRKMWGRSHYGLMPGRVERGLKESERGWV